MAIGRLGYNKPIANTDTLLYTADRSALSSIIVVNFGDVASFTAYIIPLNKELFPDEWVWLADNVPMEAKNSFETFKVALNVEDKIYINSSSGDLGFLLNGIYDTTGTTDVTVGVTGPMTPNVGSLWIDTTPDPAELKYWDGTQFLGINQYVVDSSSTTVSLATNATTLNLGGSTGTTNIKNNLDIEGANLTTDETTFNLINTTATTVNAFGAATDIQIGAATGTTNINNDLDVDGDISLDGGDILTSDTTFNLVNTTATTVNFAGAATAVNIGSASGTTTVNNDLTVTGDLTVNGTTTNLNSTNLVVEDKNIIIADVTTPTDTTADGAGITVKGATDKTFTWDNSTDAFTSSEPIIADAFIPSDSVVPTNGIYLPSANVLGFSTNTTQRMILDASGNLTIGDTTAPAGVTQLGLMFSTNTATGSNLILRKSHAESANATNIAYLKSGGTNDSPTTVAVGDIIGNLSYSGFSGTNYTTAALISSAVDGTVSNGVVPGRIVFSTADSAGANTERVRIDSAGLVTIAGDLTVNGGDLTTTATTFNILNTTATTVNAFGASTALTLGANSGTLTIGNPTILGTQTTQALFNTVATTLNIGGAATALNLGASTGSTIINNNLGIGGTPTYSLDVIKSQNAATVARVVNTNTGASAQSILQLQSGATQHANLLASITGTYFQIAGSGLTTSYYDFDTQIWRNNAGIERMKLDAGNLTLGSFISAPSSQLFVQSSLNTKPTIVSRTANIASSIGITNAVQSAGTVTYTANNSFNAGNKVTITGITPSTYNVVNATIATATATNFTIRNASLGGTYVSDGTAEISAYNQEWGNSSGVLKLAVDRSGNITTTETELLLEQTGDTFGTTQLRLLNRTGQNGPLFDNSKSLADLVDFGFQSITAKGNIRFESRSRGSTITNGSEFQFGSNSNIIGGSGLPTQLTYFPLVVGTDFYNRGVQINSSGSATIPLTIRAMPTSTATITGATVTTFANKTGTVITPQGTVTYSRITGIASTTGLLAGMTLTYVSGTGTFGGGTATILSVDTATSITINTTAAPVAGAITFSIQNSVTYTATNTFSSSQLVTITGASAGTLNVTNAVIGSANGTTFTIINTTASGTWTSGGTATVTQTAALTSWTNPAGTSILSVDSTGNLITGLTSLNVFNTTATTLNAFGAATTITMGGTPTTALTATLFGNATASGVTKTINIGTGGASGSVTNINLNSATAGATGTTKINGSFALTGPSSIASSTFTVGVNDNFVIFSAACTVTLPTASTYPGRILTFKNVAAVAIISNASNVQPLATTTAGTAILAATAGKFAQLVSNGTNWVVMMAN